MKESDWESYLPETQSIRAGQSRTAEQEHSDPLFLTSSYIFSSAAEAAARFSGKEAGNIYSRFSNPTVRAFEERLALLEGGERCIASASGMAAIASIAYTLLSAGDHVVCSQAVFGNTTLLFKNFLSRFSVETTFVSLTNQAEWEAAIRPETKLFFLETPSNPLTEIADISCLAKLAHDNGCLLVVDNVFCTPVLQQPLALGADIIVHSATKYIDGQGRCIGGAVVGKKALLEENILPFMKTCGPSMSPFNAWVFLNGLETLSLRMKAHCENATALANWLEAQPRVKKVYYPGLRSHPQFELAARQQKGAGGVLSFEIEGGKEAAWHLIDSTQLLSITANLGDTKTTITHPATTTHSKLSAEEREAAGIKDSLIRVSVGLENIEDIKSDLIRGL
ncbi:MAG: O-succinylhomoserine sulfhydrylase [Gammaproteobacteria bacterium]|nr:MAG: O-succinylhomoserine sulfhydrylase [Gammaproteobacteria bacterium]